MKKDDTDKQPHGLVVSVGGGVEVLGIAKHKQLIKTAHIDILNRWKRWKPSTPGMDADWRPILWQRYCTRSASPHEHLESHLPDGARARGKLPCSYLGYVMFNVIIEQFAISCEGPDAGAYLSLERTWDEARPQPVPGSCNGRASPHIPTPRPQSLGERAGRGQEEEDEKKSWKEKKVERGVGKGERWRGKREGKRGKRERKRERR